MTDPQLTKILLEEGPDCLTERAGKMLVEDALAWAAHSVGLTPEKERFFQLRQTAEELVLTKQGDLELMRYLYSLDKLRIFIARLQAGEDVWHAFTHAVGRIEMEAGAETG